MGEGLKRAFRAVRENNEIIKLRSRLAEAEKVMEQMEVALQGAHRLMDVFICSTSPQEDRDDADKIDSAITSFSTYHSKFPERKPR